MILKGFLIDGVFFSSGMGYLSGVCCGRYPRVRFYCNSRGGRDVKDFYSRRGSYRAVRDLCLIVPHDAAWRGLALPGADAQ